MLDDQADHIREVLEDHPNPETIPGVEALRLLASDNEMARVMRDATIVNVQDSSSRDMATTATILTTVHNYLSSNS